MHTVHAIHDIQPGEEILTAYIDPAQRIDERAEDLLERGVDCRCPSCQECMDAKFEPPSNHCRIEIYALKLSLNAFDGDKVGAEDLPNFFIPKSAGEALDKAQDLIKLLLQEGLVGMDLAAAYRWASKYNLQLGILEKATAFAKKVSTALRNVRHSETSSPRS